ncbi:unnamed protein product [Linum trigynum]|uniref:Uncharacterized protein n=1 Tax=Linum trigynum TaxID=586398 RepID=A0AAV2EA03_9ROSI
MNFETSEFRLRHPSLRQSTLSFSPTKSSLRLEIDLGSKLKHCSSSSDPIFPQQGSNPTLLPSPLVSGSYGIPPSRFRGLDVH